MSVRVRIPTPLRAATENQSEVNLESASVEDAILELESRFPSIKGHLRDENGELRRFVNVSVNGEDVRFTGGLQTGLTSADELSIIPTVAGG